MKTPTLLINVLKMHRLWKAWLLLLLAINLGGGIAFIDSSAGKSAITSVVGATIVMAIIYARQGFVPLIGIGRILFWLPMEIEFTLDLMERHPLGVFHAWLITIIAFNGLSIVLDITNVMRFILSTSQTESNNINGQSQNKNS